MKRVLGLSRLLLFSDLRFRSLPRFAQVSQRLTRPEVSFATHHDTSPPLRDMPLVEPLFAADHEKPRPIPVPNAEGLAADAADPVAQMSANVLVAANLGAGFDGLGVGGPYTPDAAPPDTNGAVGSTQYVQWVNEAFAVYNKSTGALVYGPTAGNALWSGFGGGCQNNNDGDPIVQYDKAANRWVMTQFSVSTTPYTQCVARRRSASRCRRRATRRARGTGTRSPTAPRRSTTIRSSASGPTATTSRTTCSRAASGAPRCAPLTARRC